MAQGSAPPHLIDEISKTDEVIDRARALVSAERRTTSLASTSGVTFQDAFQIVAKREEEKRKKSSKDARKRAQADQLHFPGSRIGVDSEMSAYWMVMEDYCRAVQPADIQLLLPQFASLNDDPAFTMPALGFNPTHSGQDDEDGRDQSQVNGNATEAPAHSARNAANEVSGNKRTPLKVEKLPEQPSSRPTSAGATLLHSVPGSCISHVLSVLAALFPSSDTDWSSLASAAASGKSSTMSPDIVERIRKAVAQLARSMSQGDAPPASNDPPKSPTQSAASHAANGAAHSSSKAAWPVSDQDMLALNGFFHLSAAPDQAQAVADSASPGNAAEVSTAEEAQEAVVQLMQASLVAAAERMLPQLPSLDLQSAIVPTTQELDLGGCREPPRIKPPVPPDEAVHPYLAEFLKHAVAKDPVLPIRRRSPVPATAGVTRGPAAAAAPPATPALDGTDPEPAAPAASDDDDMEDGAEPRAENGAAMLAGGDAQDGARPAGRDGQPGAATACAPAGEVSMDCSSADDRATDAKGMLSDDRPLRFTMQQRRSTRKRGRPSHHGSPVKSTRSGAGIKIEDDAGGDAEAARPNKQQATSSRGRPFKPRASKRASMNTAATPAPAKSEPLQGAGGGHTEEEGPPAASLAGSVAVSAADTAAGGGAAASGAPASEPAASGAASVHAPDTAPEATSGCQAAEQWELLNRNADLLAIAPEDEIVAEIISLQSELAQVTVANRRSCARLLEAVLPTLAEQAAREQQREQAEQDIDAFLLHMKALKRQAKQEKRDAERRAAAEPVEPTAAEAAAEAGADGGVAVARARRATAKHALPSSSDDDDDDRSPDDVFGVPLPLRAEQLIDPFALETPDVVNALCAVCGDGTSVAANQIVFCDRCNVAVHQQCYGLGEIPAGEWLCWPCKLYEGELRAKGTPQDKIRPPRFKQEGSPDYPGGSKDAECCLCPVKRGIFKQAVGSERWVHLVCAHWQTPEVSVANEDVADAVHNVDNIRADRFSMTCAYCRQRTGATVKCAHAKCHTTFHPLCARKVGCFAVCKHSTGRGRPTYKTYCPQHGEAAQRREQELASQRAAAAPDTGDKRSAGGKATRREAPAAAAVEADAPAAAEAALEPPEDVAALQKELAEKQEVYAFLNAVRFDMEAARNLAAQVETREKRKVCLAKYLKDEYEMALADPAKFAQFHSYLSTQHHQNSVIDYMSQMLKHKREAMKGKLHSGMPDPGHGRHSGGQVPIGAPQMGHGGAQYVSRQPPQQHAQQPQGDYARMQGGMAAGQLAGLPPGGVGPGPGPPIGVHERQPDFRLSAHGQPGSGGYSSSGQLMSPQTHQMRQGRQSPAGSRLLDDPMLRRHSFDQSLGSPSQSPAGLLDAAGPQPGPTPYPGDGMHFASPTGSLPSHRMSLDRGRLSSSGGYAGSGGHSSHIAAPWMAAQPQRSSGPAPYHMHGSRGSSPGFHPMQRPGSGPMPAERGMRSYALQGGEAPRMMPDPGLQAQMHPARHGEMPGGPMMDPLVRGPGPPQGRHSMQLPQGGDMRSAMWAQRGGPGQPAGMAAGPPGGQQRQSRGMHDMPYYPGSRGVSSPHRQAMRSSALAAGGAAEQHGAQGQQPPRSSRPQRAAAKIARQNNFAADPLEFMDGSL